MPVPGVVQHVVQEDAVPRMTAQTPIVTSFLTCLSSCALGYNLPRSAHTPATFILAAWFWFRPAAGKAPEMTYTEIEGLTVYLHQSARRNRWAAGFAGASALFSAITTLFGIG
jgi:hypothetical protein